MILFLFKCKTILIASMVDILDLILKKPASWLSSVKQGGTLSFQHLNQGYHY